MRKALYTLTLLLVLGVLAGCTDSTNKEAKEQAERELYHSVIEAERRLSNIAKPLLMAMNIASLGGKSPNDTEQYLIDIEESREYIKSVTAPSYLEDQTKVYLDIMLLTCDELVAIAKNPKNPEYVVPYTHGEMRSEREKLFGMLKYYKPKE